MKRYLVICMVVLLTVTAVRAQQRIFCDKDVRTDTRAMTRGPVYGSSVSSLQGDYHVPVILAAFQDVPFTVEEVAQKWNEALNLTGFSVNGTVGCVGEYFRKQSNGQFNLTFDVMGPVTLPDSMKYYGKNDGGIQGADMRPEEMIYQACLATEADFSPYDWDGDSTIDVVVVVFAGKGENRGGSSDAIWPHKFTVYGKKVGGLSLATYACVAELNRRGYRDGYGTFCHEFSHTLGLPDLYPSSLTVYSYFDEWDLMDGGNYANNSWAIPNYSAFERNLCGWFDPVELNASVSITDMPSMDEEPCAYIIRNDADAPQYYLLENRQQRGFDVFVPVNGLLVTYVDHYNGTLSPNKLATPQVSLVCADNRSYRESESYFKSIGSQYTEDGHNLYLSLAAYPYIVGDSINDHLSASSIPAMSFEGKTVSNIRMDDDGRISFDFIKEETAIRHILHEETLDVWYDLQGRRLQGRPSHKGVYIRQGKKVTL